MIGWSVCGQVSVSDGDSKYHELMQKHKTEIAQACHMAMTNILHELQGLAQQYPPLSDIGSAMIEKYGAADSGNVELGYKKNAHYEMYHYAAGTPANQMRPSLGKDIIDNGGAELTVYIFDFENPSGLKPGGGDFMASYPLLSKGGNTKFQLNYYLTLNAPDAALSKSVKDAIEKQIGLLRKTFQNILNIDPAAEKARAYAPVMTNILVGLQGLAQHISILDDMGSATIENKGPQYVYQHLHYWKNAHVATTNDALPYQAPPPMDIPFVEKGGIALDVYLRNEDEPFGFRPIDTYVVVSPDRKTRLDYNLYFNRRENLVQDSKVLMDINPNKAIGEVIENQREILRKKLDDVIDF